MSLKLSCQGWFSRFNLSNTVEISSILSKLSPESSSKAFGRYHNLRNWLVNYPVYANQPFNIQVDRFGRLIKLTKSFYLRENGIFREATHHVYSFKVGISGIYILYSRSGIKIHCSPDLSPELANKVLSHLNARLILPLIKVKKRKFSSRK